MTETEASESWLARRVENELKDLTRKKRSHRWGCGFNPDSVVLNCSSIVVNWFFTAAFGTLEIIMLYGSLIEWILVAALEALSR